MEIVLIGLNHRTASVDLRERVAFTPKQAREAAEQLRSRGILEESLVLSTCNRSELYGVPREDATDSAGAVELFVASFHQLSLTELNGSLYRHRDSHAVRHLCDRGVKQLRVLNRTEEHAVDLAARFGGEVVPWEKLPAALDWPDLIVTSVSASEPILTRDIINRAMAARGNRALLLIDLGVPRNVAFDVGEIYNTYLYNIDDLTEIVEQNKKARVAEIPRAEAIIDEQVEKFLHWQAGVAAGAVLGDLRNKLAAEHEAFVQERLASMPHLSDQDRAQVAAMLREFLDRVVLTPAERMRGIPELRRKLQNFEAIRDLFRLDREKP